MKHHIYVTIGRSITGSAMMGNDAVVPHHCNVFLNSNRVLIPLAEGNTHDIRGDTLVNYKVLMPPIEIKHATIDIYIIFRKSQLKFMHKKSYVVSIRVIN